MVVVIVVVALAVVVTVVVVVVILMVVVVDILCVPSLTVWTASVNVTGCWPGAIHLQLIPHFPRTSTIHSGISSSRSTHNPFSSLHRSVCRHPSVVSCTDSCPVVVSVTGC